MAANPSAPSGFQTIRRYDGAVPNYGSREEYIAYNYSSRINFGDPVRRLSDGTIGLYVAGGTSVHGIFRGCRYVDPNTQKTEFYPAWRVPTLASNIAVFALVDADPFMVFQCQQVGTALTTADIGRNIDITASSSGSTSSAIGLSVCSLAGPSATTATLPFRIVGIVGGVANSTVPAINATYNSTYDNNWLEVMMNTSDMLQTLGI